MTELLTARVGYCLTVGDEWFVPILARANFPLGKVTVTTAAIGVSGLLGVAARIPWETVRSLQPIWFGVRLEYLDERPHELELFAPFFWRRLLEAALQNRFEIPATGKPTG